MRSSHRSRQRVSTCTLRSLEEQAELYTHGRAAPNAHLPVLTNAKPGQSAHNWGYALDIVPMIAGKPIWDGKHPAWAQIGALGQAAGLEWYGAAGAAFYEEPHFQLPNWRDRIGGV
jgi:peptidoglycan L-alanyl-D-glutamate endopeptidase CwlK